jgi:cell division protein FtsQ
MPVFAPKTTGIVVAGLAAALVIGFFWFRDSSLVAVRQVHVLGASGPDAPKVESALRQAAQDMTTLHVDHEALVESVREFPIVETVNVSRDFPHALRITVLERRPVATASIGGKRVPITADGRVLRGATPERHLPLLDLDQEPGSTISSGEARRLLDLVAAAPRTLRRRADRAFLGDHGLMLDMSDGPALYFGDDEELEAKWLAVARVLADPTAEGVRYIDVRVPDRAAAGGLAPLVDPTADGQTPDGTQLQTEPETTVPPAPTDQTTVSPST